MVQQYSSLLRDNTLFSKIHDFGDELNVREVEDNVHHKFKQTLDHIFYALPKIRDESAIVDQTAVHVLSPQEGKKVTRK
jgi:hypothetical protein